jgi:hypothetical protein
MAKDSTPRTRNALMPTSKSEKLSETTHDGSPSSKINQSPLMVSRMILPLKTTTEAAVGATTEAVGAVTATTTPQNPLILQSRPNPILLALAPLTLLPTPPLILNPSLADTSVAIITSAVLRSSQLRFSSTLLPYENGETGKQMFVVFSKQIAMCITRKIGIRSSRPQIT